MESLIDARLIGAERATALKDENHLLPLLRRLPLGLFLTALHVARTRDIQHAFPPRLRSRLVRGPTAIDRQSDAGDRGRGRACEKHSERAQLFHGGETLVRLLRE